MNWSENIAVIGRPAPNLLRSNPDKVSIRRKVKHAGWDDTFLLALFDQMQ